MRQLPPIDQRTLPHAMRRALDRHPDKIAQRGPEGEYTFAECAERSLRIAGGLAKLGAQFQDTVAIMLDNSLDFVHLWLGLGLTGVVEVPVNTAYKGRFLIHMLTDSAARILVIDEKYVPRLEEVLEDVPTLETVVVRRTDRDSVAYTLPGRDVVSFDDLLHAEPAAICDVKPSDLIAYMYTSGTTGLSKGVETSHAHSYTYSSREDSTRPVAEDVVLVTLPLFHLAGQWYGVYQALIAGATCILEPGFSVSRFWDTVRANGVTVTILLGAMAQMLQQQAPRPDDAQNPLQLAVMAPLASDVAGFRARFDVEIGGVYGMSEIGAVLGSDGDKLVPGEAGMQRDGYELRVVDDEGNEAPVGTAGELWVRPVEPLTVMSGYHNLPEKTADTIIDGWVHTGDAFRRDEHGHFFFVDRIKDALRRRGENVSSFEVEAVINDYPAVLESAVVGVTSELTEDEIKAVVVTREGETIDPRELTEFLIKRLPYFMVPRYLEFLDELPKTLTQKIQKHILRTEGVGANVWDREAAGIVVRRDS
ncbi:crotonobetaine/carnitine-CoA ligase [Antricoccus suffuscus]|uniref:Crotonobetaine/carnitine-CoA ligase n=1 Tax=Antricoccus suffuscus TaxID=1629062 RepID=A0A2T1A1L0_9ACTN|nr:AMP-binding protein [Antricoccus suffuscus]PRZ42218.1 crotonobetaine/carnitine-CoA ligase [Antricoccus suffuscus]